MTNLEITNAYVGSNQAVKLYLGDEAIWPSTPPEPVYSAMPLTFEIISGGTIVWYSQRNPKEIEYSKDNGVTWTSITSSTATSFTVETGDKVQFRGNNYYGIGGESDAMCSSFIGSGATESTAVFEVYGNIMSLLVPTGYEGLQFAVGETNCFRCLFNHFGRTTSQSLISAKHLILPDNTVDSCYRGMFIRCAGLVEAPELPATTLASVCYQNMFQGCTGLTTAPVLPATTLAANCYANMFNGCTSLTTAPELPAATLANNCYQNMFNGCTSLTTAPELPATTLASNCYYGMFAGCTSLATTPSILSAVTLAQYCYYGMFNGCSSLNSTPVLPATTLVDFCYNNMFRNCRSLTSAPALPATTLATNCYYGMFEGCTKLNYIKCLATNISATNCTRNWVDGVASAGTFVKAAGVTWTTGANGIPSGWDVEEIEA